MDSVTHVALGASIGIACMGRRAPVWKAALAGAVCGTLPDLDVFIDHGDPVRNMTFHRTFTHSLFWLSLASLPIAAAAAAISREWPVWRRWWLAVWAALIGHPLLDMMTVYGTQLLLPFSDYPVSVGSIFIIDPAYTTPLALGVLAALLLRRHHWRYRLNGLALAWSAGYLAWGVAAQQWVLGIAERSLQAQGVEASSVLVTAGPLNTLLWRVIAMTPTGHAEAWYSLLDGERQMDFRRYRERPRTLDGVLSDSWSAHRIAWFSHGYYRLDEDPLGRLGITDLRLGMEDYYPFRFVVAQRVNGELERMVPPYADGTRITLDQGWRWLLRRTLGEPLPPPVGGGRGVADH